MNIQTIDLVYFNAGGGHRAAALALERVITDQQRPWRVRLVNLMDVLDPEGLFRKYTGSAPEDFYNKRLARGWTLGMTQELKLLQGMIRLTHATLVKRLQQHWLRVDEAEPDLVVSLVPNFNRALCESVQSALPGVPFVTVMTDIADLPPHFWIEPGPLSDQPQHQTQHLVCGSTRAFDQALASGHARDHITLTSGMILRPEFHQPLAIDAAAERLALGLDPDRPTGVLMFGGVGSAQMARISLALADMQLIVLCGRNEALASSIRAQTGVAPRAVLGFTHEVCRYLSLGDFFIGKPGPGSLSEAVQMGLPVITFDNAWTMPQERYNAQWIRDAGLGLVLKSQRGLPAAVAQMAAQLPGFKARVAQVRNRAVFEVVEVFADLMSRSERLDATTHLVDGSLGHGRLGDDTHSGTARTA